MFYITWYRGELKGFTCKKVKHISELYRKIVTEEIVSGKYNLKFLKEHNYEY